LSGEKQKWWGMVQGIRRKVSAGITTAGHCKEEFKSIMMMMMMMVIQPR